MPKNAEKYAKIILHSVSRPVCGRCLVVHKVGEGVLQRDTSPWPKNTGKNGKLEELKENCWKTVEKR